MGHIDAALALQVRVLAEPCLWYWEIRDRVDGRLVESSWASQWVAFSSREEAEAAGTSRLAELAGRRPGHRVARGVTRRAG